MDPITTAFVTALVTNLGKGLIEDSYKSLKATLKKKFGDESEVVNAVEQLEKKPDSQGRQSILQEEVENAKVYNDPEILKLAQQLLEKINAEESTTTNKYKVEFQGEVKGAQVGDNNTQQNTFN